jgi:hypothetical protein
LEKALEQDQTLIGYAAYAAATPTPDGKGETTTSGGGILTYNIGFDQSPQFYFELQWQCPEGDGGDNVSSATTMSSRAACTCQAKYGDQECAACQVCQDNDAGEWSWNCFSGVLLREYWPAHEGFGYSADCNNNYTVWAQSSSKPGTSLHLFALLTIFWMVTFVWLSLPPY